MQKVESSCSYIAYTLTRVIQLQLAWNAYPAS
jgi:hypothetical protein